MISLFAVDLFIMSMDVGPASMIIAETINQIVGLQLGNVYTDPLSAYFVGGILCVSSIFLYALSSIDAKCKSTSKMLSLLATIGLSVGIILLFATLFIHVAYEYAENANLFLTYCTLCFSFLLCLCFAFLFRFGLLIGCILYAWSLTVAYRIYFDKYTETLYDGTFRASIGVKMYDTLTFDYDSWKQCFLTACIVFACYPLMWKLKDMRVEKFSEKRLKRAFYHHHNHHNDNNYNNDHHIDKLYCSLDDEKDLPIYIAGVTVNGWQVRGPSTSTRDRHEHKQRQEEVDDRDGEEEDEECKRGGRHYEHMSMLSTGEWIVYASPVTPSQKGSALKVVVPKSQKDDESTGLIGKSINVNYDLSRVMALSGAAVAQEMGEFDDVNRSFFANHLTQLTGISMGRWMHTYDEKRGHHFRGIQVICLLPLLIGYWYMLTSPSFSSSTRTFSAFLFLSFILFCLLLQPLLTNLLDTYEGVKLVMQCLPFARSLTILTNEVSQNKRFQMCEEEEKKERQRGNSFRSSSSSSRSSSKSSCGDGVGRRNSLFEHLSVVTPPPQLYVTDGGHTENYGLLPLLVARLKTIIVCDGSQDVNRDASGFFESLRYARSLLSVEFTYLPHDSEVDTCPPPCLENALHKFARSYKRRCLMLKISYASINNNVSEGNDNVGYLLYLKPKGANPVRYHNVNVDEEGNPPDAGEANGACCSCCHRLFCRSSSSSWLSCQAVWRSLFGSFPNVSTGNQFFTPELYDVHAKEGELAANEAKREWKKRMPNVQPIAIN